jgi:hypothetical protein
MGLYTVHSEELLFIYLFIYFEGREPQNSFHLEWFLCKMSELLG